MLSRIQVAMKLYWFSSFNPQKVRFALEELGLPYERQTVDLFKREHREDWFAAISPPRQVPVMEIDGENLWESNAIVAYLGKRESRLWPSSGIEEGLAMQWLFFEASCLVQDVGPLWFYDTMGAKYGIARDEAKLTEATRQVRRPLKMLDAHLEEREWMLGDSFSLVDCSLGTTLHALSASNYDLSDHAPVLRYLDRIRSRPAWASCEFVY